MKIRWVRSNERIYFNRPHTWLILGVRGSGKSSQLEHVAEHYLDKGHCVLDLFASRDGENLAWLRSRWAKEKRILLIHGDGIKVKSEFDVKNVGKVGLKDFTDYDILISATPLYASADQQFLETNKLTNLLYKRFTWKRLVYALVREASNLYYSRLKVSENQLQAKASFIYMIREARHMGVALGLDTLRFYSVDIDIRRLADYTILKSQGVQGLTKDLHFLYSIFEPHMVRRMRPEQFLIVTKMGNIGMGVFPEVPWHKKEKENIIKAVSLDIEHERPSGAKEDEQRGSYYRVGDATHAKIISLHVEGIGYQKIADELKIASSRTPYNHVGLHNRSVKSNRYCPRCRRANGEYSKKYV